MSLFCFAVSLVCSAVSLVCFAVSLFCFAVSLVCSAVSLVCFAVSLVCFAVYCLFCYDPNGPPYVLIPNRASDFATRHHEYMTVFFNLFKVAFI